MSSISLFCMHCRAQSGCIGTRVHDQAKYSRTQSQYHHEWVASRQLRRIWYVLQQLQTHAYLLILLCTTNQSAESWVARQMHLLLALMQTSGDSCVTIN